MRSCIITIISIFFFLGTCVLSDSYGRDLDADLEYGRDWEVFEYQGEGRHCRSGGSTGEVILPFMDNGPKY